MSNNEFPSSWRDPQYVSTVVAVISVGALFFYSAFGDAAPSPETIGFVLFWVLIPTTVAYEVARRWS